MLAIECGGEEKKANSFPCLSSPSPVMEEKPRTDRKEGSVYGRE
jgi:hypothetical protein